MNHSRVELRANQDPVALDPAVSVPDTIVAKASNPEAAEFGMTQFSYSK